VVSKWGRVGTASELFKRLIMAGQLTDAEILAQVLAELGPAAGRPGYAGWYRGWLRRNGHNPPVKVTAPCRS
jgi:hypothetical protein